MLHFKANPPASISIQYQALMPFNNPLPFLDILLNRTAKLSEPAAQRMLFLIFFSSRPNRCHYHPSKGPSTNNSASATWAGFNQRICWVSTAWDTSLTTSHPYERGGKKIKKKVVLSISASLSLMLVPSVLRQGLLSRDNSDLGGEQNNNKIKKKKKKGIAGLKGLRDR